MSVGCVRDIQAGTTQKPVLICFSHLRWDFVFQRPQHLLSRAAADYTVIYFEEPILEIAEHEEGRLSVRMTDDGMLIATPMLSVALDARAADQVQQILLDKFIAEASLQIAVMWFYTPMAFGFSSHLQAPTVVYDCMDELTLFKGASPRLKLLERRLFKRADLVFCGGHSLYQAKRQMHAHAYLFASSVDAPHFAKARNHRLAEPADQAGLPHPRIGFFGVIDERMDYALVDAIVAARPDWSFVMLGPTAKVDAADLPQRANLHWLGRKAYGELPAYLSGWDVGMMPFAHNEATHFISPTKTPEYLAAGVRLVSTAIADVVTGWQDGGLVEIADTAEAFVAAIEKLLVKPPAAWLAEVDERLAGMSWDTTWTQMLGLIETAQGRRLKSDAEFAAHVH